MWVFPSIGASYKKNVEKIEHSLFPENQRWDEEFRMLLGGRKDIRGRYFGANKKFWASFDEQK